MKIYKATNLQKTPQGTQGLFWLTAERNVVHYSEEGIGHEVSGH